MALPTTIVSDNAIPGHNPPFKSSGGAFYVVAYDGTARINVYKATDPADSWTLQDGDNNPTVFVGGALTAVQDGDLIHIASINVTASPYLYHQFNMATDAWTVTSETIDNPANNPAEVWISIAVRAGPDIIVAYNGSTDANMGNDKERVDYARREGTTWTAGIALDAAGDIHYGNPNVVISPVSDRMHFVWEKQTGTVDDPPTSWNGSEGRTLDPDNSLKTVDTMTGDVIGALLGLQNAVSYDDGSDERMIWIGADSNNNRVVFRTVEDATDDLDFINDTVITSAVFINGEVGIITIAELNDDLHVLWSGGASVAADQDLFYSKSTDDGVNWDTPTEELDAITCNFISANIYVRGADTVMAYVYDDGAVQKYNEKILIAGGDVLAAQVMM